MPLAPVLGNRASDAPSHSRQGWDSFLGLWLQVLSVSSPSCPLPSPNALFMAHYSPPAGTQMLPARAVTLLCPLERTKGGGSYPLIFPLLSLHPSQPLWASAGSRCVAQLVPSSHPREPPCEQFPLCLASRHIRPAPSFLSEAVAAAESSRVIIASTWPWLE